MDQTDVPCASANVSIKVSRSYRRRSRSTAGTAIWRRAYFFIKGRNIFTKNSILGNFAVLLLEPVQLFCTVCTVINEDDV